MITNPRKNQRVYSVKKCSSQDTRAQLEAMEKYLYVIIMGINVYHLSGEWNEVWESMSTNPCFTVGSQ